MLYYENYDSASTLNLNENNKQIKYILQKVVDKLLQYMGIYDTVSINIPLKDEIINLLNSIADIDDYNGLNNLFNSNQMLELLYIINYAVNEHCEYGRPFIDVVYDNEDPAYIDIQFPECNWDGWERLENELKPMIELTKERIMITCIKGLIE